MKKVEQKKRGFTLIELLVVIAIIGILAGIILVSLNGARKKAKDAAVKSDLANVRAAMELRYSANGTSGYSGACSLINGNVSVASATTEQKNVAAYFTGMPSGILYKCVSPNSDGSVYLAAAQLPSNTAKAWCVDNTGSNRKVLWSGVSSGPTVCPAEDTTP